MSTDTDFGSMPTVLDTLASRSPAARGCSVLVLTMICWLAPEPTTCGASAGVTPASVNAVFSLSAVSEVPAAANWNVEPPLNSTP